MQKQEMLKDFDSQSRDIFENIFDFYGKLSLEGFILNLSGKIFEKASIQPEILIGQKFSHTVFWQSSDEVAVLLDEAIATAAGGEKSKVTLNFRINAKEKILVELILKPLDNKEIFFCGRDISASANETAFYRNRSEQMLYAAENSEIGLWFMDLASENVFSTPKCNEFLGIPSDEPLTLSTFLRVLDPNDRPHVEEILRDTVARGSDFDTEFRVINTNGNVNWLVARGKTFLDAEGEPATMVGMVQKITERKIADKELAKIYAREKRARDEAEEANRAKDFFLAFVSHELRSPLNAILGWTKILLTKEVNEETRINALETIERSARSQAKLINDLVDSARVASGKLRLEFRPVNLTEIVQNVCDSQKPTAETKKIELQLNAEQDGIQIFGDSIRLQQVFTNLLSNAIKFTPEGGLIQLTVQIENSNAEVAIKDTGQGISAEALPRIFSQFSQGDEKISRDTTGLGLGLSIVKTLVEKHGGAVRAGSEGIGKGSTFTVTLPITDSVSAAMPQKEENALAGEEKLLGGIKVLIVEDDQDSAEILELFLNQTGAAVNCAMSAKQAIDTLQTKKNSLPDIIISDLGMPEEDGYSLIQRIRNLPAKEGGKIPAIALSAFVSNDNKQKAFDAGFQKYHTKPFEPDLLIKEVLQLLEK